MAVLIAAILIVPGAAVITTGTVLAKDDEDAPSRRGRAMGNTERVKVPEGPNVLTSPIILPGPGVDVPIREPSQPAAGGGQPTGKKRIRGIIDVLEGKEGGERKTPAEPPRGGARPGIDYIPNAETGVGDGPAFDGGARPGIDYIPREGSQPGGTQAGGGGKVASTGKGGRTGGDAGTGETVPVALSYSETSEGTAGTSGGGKRSDDCQGGSLTQGMNCVVKRMDGGGGGAGGSAGAGGDDLTATLDVDISSVLETSDGGKTYRVRLKVGEPSVSVPEDMDATSKRLAKGDAAIVVARLRKWTKILNAEDVRNLKQRGSGTLRLRSPFRGLRKLKLGGPVRLPVSLGEEEMDIVLRFVRAAEKGFAPITGKLKFGEEFFLEAKFKEEPKETLKLVRLFYDDLPGTLIQVERTGDDTKIYRSKGYHLMDDGRGTR
jgi:hypothetical protein